MNKTYNNKTAFITGGSRGIGASIAQEFAKNNCNVIVNYLENKEAATKLCNKLATEYNIQAFPIQGDISKEESVLNMLNTIKEKSLSIDYLINNAGIAIDSTIEDKTVTNFEHILDVNLIGTFLMCKHFGNYMLSKENCSIVNISSTNGIDSFYPYSMDYDASKAGVISLNHNFAKLYAPKIRVNCICPGWVNTDMNKQLDEEYIKEEEKHILLERFANPDEIASLVYYVASQNTYLNDSIIKIDGGRC